WAAGGKTMVANTGKSRIGIVFDGGRSKAEWLLFIQMHEQYISGRRTVLAELLLNRRFADVGREAGASPVNYAKAVSNRTIELRVPPVYRKFAARFVDVVKSIRGSYYYGPPPDKEMDNLARRLETGKPEEKYQASVTLEGIGSAAVGYLEKVSGDDWTTLYSGQALCYLNSDIGRTRIIAACESSTDEIRYEAVRFLSNLSGRTTIQALRAKVLDPSNRISIEALKGLMGRGDEYAKKTHVSGFDLVAVPGVDATLIVSSSGRPVIAVTGSPMPLQGTVELRLDGIGIGSTDSDHVGIITSLGSVAETITVKATAYDILAALARHNPPFEAVRKVITALEDAGNLPYKVTWME
ncbi:MAG: hypothetical protein J7M19_01130, partial [Planctomycetes bacterium]|nr:hypothetical protein [Planctomycetota bacterium]